MATGLWLLVAAAACSDCADEPDAGATAASSGPAEAGRRAAADGGGPRSSTAGSRADVGGTSAGVARGVAGGVPQPSAAGAASTARCEPGGSSFEALGRATPLFANAPAIVPISFMRDDGVLVTRGAGRVRQRHELEGTYGPFGPLYFEDRTYGFIIEDFTARGESRLRVTYLPVARPQDSTNFRCWKVYGNGNVFSANTGMDSDTPLPSLRAASGEDYGAEYAKRIAPYARIQSHEVTRNARTNAPIQKGDQFDFEFGIFIEPSEVAANGRTSYYTDTFRYRVGTGGLTPENFDTSGEPGPALAAFQGGATTLAWLYAEPETAFSQMSLNIQHEHVQRFVEGRRLFHTSFDTGAHSESGNPALPEQAHKAGPLFVTSSCESCHAKNGGGQPLTAALDEKSSTAFKLYGPDEPRGSQLHLQDGSARLLSVETREVTLADGTVVKLSRPRYEVKKSSSAPQYSPRIARRLLGLGLLEAIDEETILAHADPNDCNGDGISGRPSIVMDPGGTGAHLGRFGWRAEKVSVEHQIADALSADIGVETRVIPGPNGEVELDDAELDRLTTYMRLLGVPPRRDAQDATVERGALLFSSIGCANCHVPEQTTGVSHPFVELRGQTIQPYTDLLLHYLGPDLADPGAESRDGTRDESATAGEWRTAPLWGVGWSAKVQGYTALLNDGRAKSVLEAVLWHGGEASAVRERVVELRREDREALLRFVESL